MVAEQEESLVDLPPRPTAQVAVDISLAHLDRPFDYLVPKELADQVAVGVRVKVRFAGRLRDGFVLGLGSEPDSSRTLAPVHKVVSREPVLTPQVAALVRAVADHCAGTFADVVRLAVPPRHAATEKAARRQAASPGSAGPVHDADPVPDTDPVHDADPIATTPTGEGFLAALGSGGSPRAFWQIPAVAAPAGDWAEGFLTAARATLEGGRGVIALVPDARELERLRRVCAHHLGAERFAVLSADLGPAARYRSFLRALRGEVQMVIGTRAAAYAPVRELGLIALFDDGDDLYAEPRAPYPHTREVLALRASLEGTGVLLASNARSCAAQAWIEQGWLTELQHPAGVRRRMSPAIRLAADTDWELERDPLARSVRLPHRVFTQLRAGLAQGPVLVQVPRAGYLVVLVCGDCSLPVACPRCQGPVRAGARQARCEWCAQEIQGWRCPDCGSSRWRAPVVGAERTAEELQRAFPGVEVMQSSGSRVIDEVPDEPALVVCTPGGEARAEHGFAAAVLLDAELLLTRVDLHAAEEALRRWLNAVALVRPGADGGSVVAVGPTSARALQALVRNDPGTFASWELQERSEAHLPPMARLVTVEGPESAVAELLAALQDLQLAPAPEHTEILGPVPMGRSAPPGPEGDGSSEQLFRATVRCPPSSGAALMAALKQAQAWRTAHKRPGALRVRNDPPTLG